MLEITIEYRDSFYLKTNPDVYKEALQDIMKYVGDDIVKALMDESPVRTGRLRDSHYVHTDNFMCYIGNTAPYAKYVVYGTSRQAPNNYPSRVITKMGIGDKCCSRFEESLITRGVL